MNSNSNGYTPHISSERNVLVRVCSQMVDKFSDKLYTYLYKEATTLTDIK